MDRPETPEKPGSLRRVSDLALRIALPAGIVLAVLAVLIGERADIDHELQLVVPPAARPGERIAVRAFIFDRIGQPDGPRLVSARVRGSLVDSSGHVVARATLHESVAGGAEGELQLPRGAQGTLLLRMIARVGGEDVATAEARLRVAPDAPALPRSERPSTALQSFALGEVRATPGAVPPSDLEVRVVGGACVPESDCTLIARVGDPPAALRLEPGAAVEPAAPIPADATSGLVRLRLRMHGPEAQVELVASREGAEVARRTIQLPVALATAALEVDRMAPARPELRVHVLGDRPGIIVDAFRDDRWAHTFSHRTADRFAIPALDPGLWRLQVRTDPFSSDRAAVRFVHVARPGETPASIASHLGAADVAADPAALDWILAPREGEIVDLPAAISGYEADVARLEAERGELRWTSLLALALGLVVAVVYFFRRGLDAALQAQRVMDLTGDPELASARHRRRTILSALLIVIALLAALAGGAAMLVARAHLWE